MKFHSQQCPICNQVMRLKSNFGVSVYYCSAEDKSHYEIESDTRISVEHIYVFPYAVDNFDSSRNSRVYQWNGHKWSFLKEVNRLIAEPKEQFLKKIEASL